MPVFFVVTVFVVVVVFFAMMGLPLSQANATIIPQTTFVSGERANI
jgi:hypothetical protein